MSKFIMTREWLVETMAYAEQAAEVTYRGDVARALLRAAWKGMGYAPHSPTDVFDFVPAATNPNWLRYHRARKPENTKRAKPDLRVVADNVEDKES
jgi:hypothetical protein